MHRIHLLHLRSGHDIALRAVKECKLAVARHQSEFVNDITEEAAMIVSLAIEGAPLVMTWQNCRADIFSSPSPEIMRSIQG